VDPLLDQGGEPRIAAASFARSLVSGRGDGHAAVPAAEPAGPDPALVGTLVHRLFQASHGAVEPDDSWLAARARSLVCARDEGAAPDEIAAVVAAAVEAFSRLRSRDDVTGILDGATCEYELPFSMRLQPEDGQGTDRTPIVVRGSIDCLAQRPDGTIVVVELKTGRPRDWHAAQLDLYVRAARSVCPGRPVEGRLIYL
jgi:ATP-dependent exoDNAse (exonuclease V) beta subunit